MKNNSSNIDTANGFGLAVVDSEKYDAMTSGNYDASTNRINNWTHTMKSKKELGALAMENQADIDMMLMDGNFEVRLKRKLKHPAKHYFNFYADVKESGIRHSSTYEDIAEKITIFKNNGIHALKGGLKLEYCSKVQISSAFKKHYDLTGEVVEKYYQ